MILYIPGKPIPNNTKYGARYGKIYSYKPKAYVEYKKCIQFIVAQYMIRTQAEPIKSPAEVSIVINLGIPKSYSKKRRNALLSAPAPIKPDGDNICKTILDSISKEKGLKYYLLEDDKLACKIVITKYYAATPSVELTVNKIF